MECLIKIIINHWWWMAVGMSLLWGIRGVALSASTRESWRKFFECSHQFIFNFIGSMAGWCCFYVLAIRLQNKLPKLQDFSLADLLLFIFALLGLTGHLPQTICGLLGSFEKLGKAVAKKISSM
jgi:hypothetical protein